MQKNWPAHCEAIVSIQANRAYCEVYLTSQHTNLGTANLQLIIGELGMQSPLHLHLDRSFLQAEIHAIALELFKSKDVLAKHATSFYLLPEAHSRPTKVIYLVVYI